MSLASLVLALALENGKISVNDSSPAVPYNPIYLVAAPVGIGLRKRDLENNKKNNYDLSNKN